jgi:hypothetical protein
MAAAANQKASGLDTPTHRSNQANQRKTGRPPARRGRLGRNQYTRDLQNGDSNDSPMRDGSMDPNAQSRSPQGHNGINGESGKSSRPKYHNPTRTSMNEMKRRVAAILEFVGRMQKDKNSQQSSASESGKSTKGGSTPNGLGNANAGGAVNSALVQAVESGLSTDSDGVPAKDFAEMASGEMLETLGNELAHWQTLYGKYGEK